jgi:hypothetical protein
MGARSQLTVVHAKLGDYDALHGVFNRLNSFSGHCLSLNLIYGGPELEG